MLQKQVLRDQRLRSSQHTRRSGAPVGRLQRASLRALDGVSAAPATTDVPANGQFTRSPLCGAARSRLTVVKMWHVERFGGALASEETLCCCGGLGRRTGDGLHV